MITVIRKQKNIGGGVVPVIGTSELFLKSTDDINNPVVGNVLYFDLDYVSQSNSLQDYSATIIEFKRDGVVIPLFSDATQYVITQYDRGAILSLEVSIIEQDGTIQPTLVAACNNIVTGVEEWTLGELQTSYEALYYPSSNTYPLVQRHLAEDETSTYKFKSLSGNGVDMVAPQASNILSYDVATNSVYGFGAGKLQYIADIPSYNADAMTYFIRFKVPSADAYFFKDMGLGNVAFFDTPNNRVDYDGLRSANGSLVPDDEVIVILRSSSTGFTTINGVAGQKREIYVKVISGGTPGEYHAQAPSEFVTSFTYGLDGGVTNMAMGTAKVKAWGMSTGFMDDTEMTNLINYLSTI